jgi:hypothetical protein
MKKKILKEENKKEIAVIEEKKSPDEVMSLLIQAVEQKLPVETMERLFSLREKIKSEKAKEEFTKSLSNFQMECPEIPKTKKVLNKDGKTIRYQYAPLETIIKKIKKPLSDNGLSYNWSVENSEGMIEAKANITHILGHTESSSFSVPIDKEGFMTAPQKYASALTFAKRYSLINALGISTGEEDTDATDVNKEPIPKSIKSQIIFSLKSLNKKTDTKEQIINAVKELTQLDLEEKNYIDIAGRLEVIIKQKNEDINI